MWYALGSALSLQVRPLTPPSNSFLANFPPLPLYHHFSSSEPHYPSFETLPQTSPCLKSGPFPINLLYCQQIYLKPKWNDSLAQNPPFTVQCYGYDFIHNHPLLFPHPDTAALISFSPILEITKHSLHLSDSAHALPSAKIVLASFLHVQKFMWSWSRVLNFWAELFAAFSECTELHVLVSVTLLDCIIAIIFYLYKFIKHVLCKE